MWARVHKVDRVRPQPNGGAIILIEDERGAPQMARVPSLSTLIAVARVLDAKQVLDAKYDGKGEVRYAPAAPLPSFLADAVSRAGAHVSDRTGEKVVQVAQPASIEAIVDVAFSDLAHHMRGNMGIADLSNTLKHVEADRRKSPLDREKHPLQYWPAVFELAALAGELARSRGGRWVEIREMPVPFAMRFPDGKIAHPTTVAQKIVGGEAGDFD
ncbi:MAG TPA: hypothetical protein VFQ65_14600 [Kofleriaceae bacterium]|nr:hypothetical protein [Kofleriaceae bacterium]